MTPTVSVLLPARNAAGTLGLALASLRHQTFREMEILVVDDASTDGTREVAAAAARVDSRVRVLEGTGRGIVPALELARGHASGIFLARMDADDLALPSRIADQLAVLSDHPQAGVCGTGVRYVPEARVAGGALRYQRWLNALTTPEALHRDRFVECPLAHPTWLMRAEAAERAGGYRDPGWPEDYDLLLRMTEGGWELATVPGVRLLWRESGERLSRRHPRYAPDAFLRCRVHYLRRAYPDRSAVVVWGAGPTGKAFSRAWRAEGGGVLAFVELDPRKLGQEIHGAPVVAPEELAAFRGALGAAAVGRAGARAEVREGFRSRGWREGRDFITVA
ncbi:MAG TPA: glycosyltransferase [Longimicrobiales bacterium]|nr:glycosyltransferase [Longimicrobiales bacterium]